jgi:hypothetical protein
MMRKYARHLLYAGDDADGFKNLLLLFRLEIQIGRREISEPRRRGHGLDRRLQFFGRLRQQL